MLDRVDRAVPELASSAPGAAPLVMPARGEGVRIVRGGRTLLDVDRFMLEGTGLSAIVGPNGAGKSLLLRVMAGLVKPDSGIVTWAGVPPNRQGYRRLGVMLQGAVLMRRSARANLEFPLRALGLPRDEIAARADRLLRLAGLEHLQQASARVLSGGEKQRLSLVRTLATDPELLFLDEPSASLDPASTLSIERIVAASRDAGVRIILVTHDVAQARRLADDVIFMHHGRIVERGTASRFFEMPSTPEARKYLAGEILI
ncbi:MAG: ABC transporter ATP-binding protein [Alphaproteobacteria bacterium]|nr:ABC transporter ATP-binding protein [Alphaproteobacteria bacterium]